jgi:hypothetical protein
MRLTLRQIHTVKAAVAQRFGSDARVWVFGSRVDAGRRGGDYDFYLETPLTDPVEIIDRKLGLLADLHATPEFEGEKIDLVVRPLRLGPDLPIDRIAKAEGKEL